MNCEMSEMKVRVGIMESPTVEVFFNGVYISDTSVSFVGSHRFDVTKLRESQISFSPLSPEESYIKIKDVTIGKDFHWQQKESQRFKGDLVLKVKSGRIIVINEISIEEYLVSVVSSEMKATAPLEFLKAHAIISRSWLISQITQKSINSDSSHEQTDSESEKIVWYDHSQHCEYDVCADDHCQRYQGISRIVNSKAVEAIRTTEGLILTYAGKICDARFSKCCGGAFEIFPSCWGNEDHPYLSEGLDREGDYKIPNLSEEETARKWILSYPQAFCNINDDNLLRDSLNGYDRTTTDFYRWRVEYEPKELTRIVNQRTGIDFGEIKDILPLERGVSGRLIKVRISGTKKSMTIGKELEIRRTLSDSHLYSSAFVIDKISDDNSNEVNKFIIRGAGWGHGVGLCQIGAVGMAAKGYNYKEILSHYYPGSDITKISLHKKG